MVAQARAINATDPTVLLGQRPDAANPDAPPLGPLSLNPLNNANLLPQNLIPSAPGEGTMVRVQPDQESENTTFRALLSRLKNRYRRAGRKIKNYSSFQPPTFKGRGNGQNARLSGWTRQRAQRLLTR
jgi:hypothetical protein